MTELLAQEALYEGKLFHADVFATDLRIEIARRNIDMRTASFEIGCSHATVSRICGGKSPDVENYLRIKRWLDRARNLGGKP